LIATGIINIMKKIWYIILTMALISSLTVEPACARRVYRQNRRVILKAIEEKPDLFGEDKASLRKRFGYPVNIQKKDTREGKRETWLYQPFKTGTKKIVITFLNDKIVDVIYQ